MDFLTVAMLAERKERGCFKQHRAAIQTGRNPVALLFSSRPAAEGRFHLAKRQICCCAQVHTRENKKRLSSVFPSPEGTACS